MKKIVAVFLVLAMLSAFVSCNNGEKSEGKAYAVEEYRTTMQYYDDFKILHLTDLHFGIETDIAHQLEIIENEIEEEKPDLVILTGDNFMYASKGVVRSLISALNSACAKLSAERGERITKFTMTFGNHDNQGDYSRYFINETISEYTAPDGKEVEEGKFAAFIDYEDDDLFGLTNFYIDLVDDRAKDTDTQDVKYRLHIIDSNTYHFVGPDYDYDVIHTDQLDHALNIYNEATADKSYIGMAFFHIPLYEYSDAYEEYLSVSDPSSVGQGVFRENALCGYENNGSYEKLRAANIVAYFCGHDHINYGDFIYRAQADASERAIFSYGVKATNQLYHDEDMIGYKTITLKDITVEEFLTIDNVKENFKNYTGGYSNYENN